jgi:putative membrane fusion protein
MNNTETIVKKPRRTGPTITVIVVMFLLIVFFLLAVSSQLIRIFYNPLRTEFALYYEDTESVLFKGVYIRNEQQVTLEGFAEIANNPAAGVIYYTNKCGAKLQTNSVIAVVYPNQDEINNRRRITELQEQIDTLSEAKLFVGATIDGDSHSNAQIEAFTGQLSDTHLQILRNIGNGNFEQASGFKNTYLGLQGKINATRGTAEGFGLDERINELEIRKALLEGALRGSIRQLQVSEPGYFVSNADGYEDILRFDNALDITAEKIEDIINNPTLPIGANVAGKTIDHYIWRMAALVPTERTRGVSQGSTVRLRIGTYPRVVSAQIVRSQDQGDGNTLFVFESELLVEEFVKKRVASVRLLLDDYIGIRLPQSAVAFRTNEEGEREQGVFVRNGSVLVFRRIELLRSEDGFVIVADTTGRRGWLQLYDEVVVRGRDLYDGKIV